MTTTQFIVELTAAYAANVEISKRKNTDYAGANTNDAFANFRVIETLSQGRISVEQGIVTRMTDKLQRVVNLLTQDAAVKDESIADTLSDLANYAMILRIYMQANRKDRYCSGQTAGSIGGVPVVPYPNTTGLKPLMDAIEETWRQADTKNK